MTELFEIGGRILAHGRRLLAAPTLAGMPTAYASLVRDPSDLLAETWGGAEHAGAAPEEASAASAPFRREDARPRLARTGDAAAAEPLSGGPPSLFLNAPPQFVQPFADVSKAVPLPLPESRPRTGPTSLPSPPTEDGGYAASSSRHGAAPGRPRRELPHGGAAPGEGAESYGPKRAHGEAAAKVVEWPATRRVPAVGAALATPGNVLQEMEEEWGSDPELQRLRGQLEVEEGKRRRLRPEAARETGARVPEAVQAEAVRAYGDFIGGSAAQTPASPAAQTPTSFSPLTPLLSKNVTRAETADELAPRVPEVVRGGGSPWARGHGGEEERAGVERTGGERMGTGGERTGVERAGREWTGVERTGVDEPGPRSAAPLVEEVLEELYERLRLEFARSYGTTGG